MSSFEDQSAAAIAHVAEQRALQEADMSLEWHRHRALTDIDQMAENVRRRFITAGSGQAATYLRKEQRARAFLTLADPAAEDPADWPMLSAEIGTTGTDLTGVAQVIVAQADAWEQVASDIEGARLKGKAEVQGANSKANVDAVLSEALAALDRIVEVLS